MIDTTRTALFAATYLVALAAPAAVRAQSQLAPVHVTASRTAEAAALEERAVALYGTPKKWRKAAALHEEAAELRTASDARSVYDLKMAAHIYYASRAGGLAYEAMARAAEWAELRGEFADAANAYVDAGLMAAEAGRGGEVPDLARKALTLANSPLLTSEQRAAIVARVGYSEMDVAALTRAP